MKATEIPLMGINDLRQLVLAVRNSDQMTAVWHEAWERLLALCRKEGVDVSGCEFRANEQVLGPENLNAMADAIEAFLKSGRRCAPSGPPRWWLVDFPAKFRAYAAAGGAMLFGTWGAYEIWRAGQAK